MARRRGRRHGLTGVEIRKKQEVLCAQGKHVWEPLEIKRNFTAKCYYCQKRCLTRLLSKEQAEMVRKAAKLQRELYKKVEALYGPRRLFNNAGY